VAGRVHEYRGQCPPGAGIRHTGVSLYDWKGQVHRYSLGWVTARQSGELIGFVNVAWDGGSHAFLLDTMVRQSERGRGLGQQIVGRAVEGARKSHCEWLHVDFEDEYESFYLGKCGFQATRAGLMALQPGPGEDCSDSIPGINEIEDAFSNAMPTVEGKKTS
jgi:GNAT superfamily N-acetyltransferase